MQTQIAELIEHCSQANRLKGKLLKDIVLLNDRIVFFRDSESDLLIKLPNGLYHFEIGQYSCEISTSEFRFV
jgi:hypothetical protein